MDRKILIDLLDDFAFGSHDIEQTADRITELYKETQALQLQQTGVMRSNCIDESPDNRISRTSKSDYDERGFYRK